MFTGSAWMIGMRWTIRGIGLVSTVILARLLHPSDFGLLAMAMLVVSFLEVFGETGQRLAIIRHAAPDRELLDTAWTLSVCQGVLLASAMLCLAPYAAAYFHEPRIAPLIRFLSLRAFIGGFENIAIIRFRRELEFANDFRFNVYQKLSMFITTLTLALYFRTYWALAAGIVVGRVLSTILSYRMVPYRPRLSVARLREIWGFSNWMLFVHLGDLFQRKTSEFIVARVFGTTSMGVFTMADDLATSPTVELAVPASRALFSSYARLAHDRLALARSFLSSLSAMTALCASIGVGVALVADDLVPLVLGAQWTQAAPLLPWLALAGIMSAIMSTTLTVLNVDGRARTAAALVWTRNLTVTLLVGWTALSVGRLEPVAAAQTAALILLLPASFWVTTRVMAVSWRDLFDALASPVAAATIMTVAVWLVPSSITPGLPRLAARAAVGSVSYVLCLAALWHWRGRPAGLEAMVYARLSEFVRRSNAASRSNESRV